MNYYFGMLLFLLQLTALCYYSVSSASPSIRTSGIYLDVNTYGDRLFVLVAFDATYTFAKFMATLQQFASALNCPYRNQLVTFYFGNMSMQIDCDYGSGLVECVRNRIADNQTSATMAFESATNCNAGQNISSILPKLMTSLFNDYRENEYVNNTYLPGTYMFMKKIFLVTNFINETFLGSIENNISTLDIVPMLAINSDDLFISKQLYDFNVKNTLFKAKIAFNAQGIDRVDSISRYPTVVPHNHYCVSLSNGPNKIYGPSAPTQLILVMVIENNPIRVDRRTIISNFFRQIANRIASDYCTIGFNATTGRELLIDHILFYIQLLPDHPDELYYFRMPWSDRKTIVANAQMFVDNWLDDSLDSDPIPLANLSYERPHSTICNGHPLDVFTDSLHDDGVAHRHILFVSNIVFDCLALRLFDGELTMSEYLAKNQKFSVDYVYFNNDEFQKSFIAADLYQSLSPAFWRSTTSQSHLYFVNSIDNLNEEANNVVAFCVDSLLATSLVDSRKYIKSIDKDLSNIVMLSIVSSLALIIVIVAAIVLFRFTRNYYQAKRLRLEFIRQTKVNERHEFDYIRTLWQVAEQNVEIDYDNPIGKGAQSIVYSGKLKQKSPIADIFSESNLWHFADCPIAVKKARPFATDYFYEQTLNEIRICSMIGYHRNICAMLGYVSTQSVTCLLLELADSNLSNALEAMKNQTVNSSDCIRYLQNISLQIADAMLFVCSKNLIHRDLAARNVLLTANNRAMLTDFGLCVECEGDEYVQELSCPLPIGWLAIESINEHRFSEKSDVWAFGILLYEMYSLGAEPYPSIPIKQLKSFLNSDQRMDKPAYADDNIYGLMLHCWKANPADRPSFSKMKKLLNETMSIES